MDHVIKIYKEAFAEYGDSEKSVLWPKGKQKERFEALCQNIHKNDFSILDFGCGTAELYNYLNKKFDLFEYTGVDIVEDFIFFSKEKYALPNAEFSKIDDVTDVKDNYDFIVASGTFNTLFVDSYGEHFKILQHTLFHLFNKTNRYLAINLLNKDVDFIQKGSYHQDVMELYYYAVKNLSKRVVIDQSYMPYEFTIIIYKDQTIIEHNKYRED